MPTIIPQASASISVFSALLVSIQAFGGEPPALTAKIQKCDAKLEYTSKIAATGNEPAYQLTNSILNEGAQSVTDLDWTKPGLSSSELKPGSTVSETYAISQYERDKDSPITFWYQGCKAPAEAYLQMKEGTKNSALKSRLTKTSGDSKTLAASAEITVSRTSDYIEYEIQRYPSDIAVALTGATGWLNQKSFEAAAATASETGYSFYFMPPIKFINNGQLDRLHAAWAKEDAIFTKQKPGADSKSYVRIRMPANTENSELGRARLILVDSAGNLLATGSYATFLPK